ncbi:50S ribosomal protein L13e [Acidianus ambivalens]|uniref:Large ribosomal subunit protein eL13 n=1 Tax=Acidianus ambivalens TaxID=2283 RepID=A0A650CW50_ACIAM|nr:50S ribosomal protein L13e [Acidianus ambivalens]MQL56378.1 50S ribosomal protein L13e [Acidianus ambivalens]QGR21998.1 50S ribosomal protein L13e [Acidianus ambivalens]
MNPPTPIIKRPNYSFEYPHERKSTREGRGFSLGELKAVNLTPEKARKLGLRVDKRRKSVHQENVDALKKYLDELNKEKSTQSKT